MRDYDMLKRENEIIKKENKLLRGEVIKKFDKMEKDALVELLTL
jgi:hypothetical protein